MTATALHYVRPRIFLPSSIGRIQARSFFATLTARKGKKKKKPTDSPPPMPAVDVPSSLSGKHPVPPTWTRRDAPGYTQPVYGGSSVSSVDAHPSLSEKLSVMRSTVGGMRTRHDSPAESRDLVGTIHRILEQGIPLPAPGNAVPEKRKWKKKIAKYRRTKEDTAVNVQQIDSAPSLDSSNAVSILSTFSDAGRHGSNSRGAD
jgi:hypothetical protein